MQPPLTEHARIRMQQRGIPAAALEILLDFGREAHDHRRGCRVVLFDKRCRRKLADQLGRQAIRLVERYLDAYAIVGSDDAVVTVGHRHRKFEHV
jgi:hypothetical protein